MKCLSGINLKSIKTMDIMKNNLLANGKRVRKNSSPTVNMKIDKQILENIKKYADRPEREVTERIRKLDREWDIERVLEVNMSTLALTGIALSIFSNRKWLTLPTVVLAFFAQHAIQGWSLPDKLLRYLKVRTRDEIDVEKYALKALKGDFEDLRSAEEALIAAKKRGIQS